MDKKLSFDSVAQFAIPILTITGQMVISMKLPQWGLLVLLAAQPFWLYSTWKSYKQAGQIGILLNTILFTLITIFGLLNYWMF